MMRDLTKPEKKLSRELIQKALQQEYENAICDMEISISNWRNKKFNTRETYMSLYKKLTGHDKHIAMRYNGITGSHYLETVEIILRAGLITRDDIAGFSEESKEYLLSYLNL